jgi:hypothetical protein
MDKYGKSPDNSEKQKPVKVEKVITPSINSMLSSNQFGHLQTAIDKNT